MCLDLDTLELTQLVSTRLVLTVAFCLVANGARSVRPEESMHQCVRIPIGLVNAYIDNVASRNLITSILRSLIANKQNKHRIHLSPLTNHARL